MDTMTRPAPQRQSRTLIVVILSAVAVATLAVTTFALWQHAYGADSAPSGPGTAALGTAPPTPPRLHVVDLMARAGCKGGVIGTQLYSYETGRCDVGGSNVTIAVFDTDELRDRWVEMGRQFGGTFVIGDGWAAGLDKPNAAETVASKLDGRSI